MTAATAKKDELTGQWNVMSKDMPILVADWQKKFDELLASKKLPKTATPERIEEIKAQDGRREQPRGRRPPRRSMPATSRARWRTPAP